MAYTRNAISPRLPYHLLGILWIVIVLNASCTTQRRVTEETPAERVVKRAMEFRGTPYRYGGETREGMDCSGLVHRVIEEEGIPFPRTSAQMSEQGKKLSLNEVRPGDLLFFHTGKRRGRINHVGLVVEVDRGEVRFIHSTTQRGVIVTSLSEDYWRKAYRRARRVM